MKKNSQGFTILELMISMTVFSVILLICMTAFLAIGRTFYRGVNIARTSQVSSAIMNEMVQEGQHSKSIQVPSAGTAHDGAKIQAICIDNKRYTFRLGKEALTPTNLQGPTSNFGIRKDLLNGRACTSSEEAAAPALDGATELLGDHMMANYVNFSPQCNDVTTKLCTVDLVISYVGGDGSDTTVDTYLSNKANANAQCISGDGSEYCAVEKLHTNFSEAL